MSSMFNRETVVIDEEHCKNFAVLVTALRHTVDGLENFVKDSVNDLHKRISNKCRGFSPCFDDCPKTYNKNFTKWCKTCKKWKDELAKFMRVPGKINRVQWKDFSSKCWTQDDIPYAANQAANVFVHNCRDPMKNVTEDILDILSLFENCSYFTVGKKRKLLSDVRKVRNVYFAHNTAKFTINEVELDYCLTVLSELLGDISMQNDKKSQQMHKYLCDLKEKEKRKSSRDVSKNTLVIQSLLLQNPHQAKLKVMALILNKKDMYLNRHSYPRFDWFLFFLCLCWFQYVMDRSSDGNDHFEPKDCKTMNFQFPWKSVLTFKPYINNFDDFVGREWMIEDFSYELIHTSRRGILLAAELGFGKSALVSHIACSFDKLSPAFPLFEKMAAIHLCKYHSSLTLDEGIFVQNLAGKLSELYPEIGNYITTDITATEYISSSKCSQDPEGCFDYIILDPLRNTKIGQNTLMIIIIDALDECIESGPKNILLLLKNRISDLPPNIKFLLTSRNISSIRENIPSGISLYQNSNFRDKNLDDIKKYLREKLITKAPSKQYQQFLFNLGPGDDIEMLAKLCGGNFLFLKHALDFWVQEGNVNNFPSNVEDIYRINFIRIFGNDEHMFSNARLILEILCASRGSVSESILFDLLNIEEEQQRAYFSRLISNELSHFIQKISGKIMFNNRGIADFFRRQDNVKNSVQISKQNGHKLLAQYWVRNIENKPNQINPIHIINTFHHFVCSRNQNLGNQIIKAVRKCLRTTKCKFLKHYIASINLYDAMLLAIDSSSETDIDNRDEGNSTASYIAAARGNDKSLAALFERGADVHFQRSQPVFSKILPGQDPIHLAKYIFQWGYNLANIASQNGHENVLKLLIEYGINICHENAIGLNSFHLASEHGHISILSILLSSSKCNFSLNFQTSLYLAAKNGHINVVKYLLSLNVVDKCVPCSDAMNWIPKGKVRLQSNIPYRKLPEQDYTKFVLKDDRRLFFCETAIDIAVQNKHLDIVKLLANNPVNALACVNARGMTPLITAAAFESHDIVLFLLKTRFSLNDTCKVPVMRSMETRIYGSNKNHLSGARLCVKGLSFWHILAVYASKETMKSVYRLKQFSYTWSIKDINGATPVHYLFCNPRFLGDNETCIQYLELESLHLLKRAKNGSTPIASAALCGNYIYIYAPVILNNVPIDIKDNSNKNFLHYFAMSDLKYISTDILFVLFNTQYEKLFAEQDVDGRTPLHYAALAGKTFLSERNNTAISHKARYYMIRDKNNMTALEILFKSMPALKPEFGKHFMKVPFNCTMKDLFTSPKFVFDCLEVLDEFEFFAFQAFFNLKDTSLIQKSDISTFLQESLNKNRFYLINMIKSFFPQMYKSIFKKKVHIFLAQLLRKSTHPDLSLAFPFFADLVQHSCKSKQHSKSLSYIFYDKHRKFWPMYMLWNITNLKEVVVHALKECNHLGLVDAVIRGGNMIVFPLANLTEAPSYSDLRYEIKHAPCITGHVNYLTPLQLFQYSFTTTDYPLTPYSHPDVWKSFRTVFLHFIPCSENTGELSFDHFAAAKGLSLIVIHIKGNRVCNHTYSITPHMLAFFFNHEYPFDEHVNTNRFYTSHYVSLLFKTVMDFHTFVFPKNSAAWRCYRYIHVFNRMSLKRVFCKEILQNEICNLISEVYANNWHLVYQMYSFTKINKYVDHGWMHPFNFVDFLQQVGRKCHDRSNSEQFVQVEAFKKAEQIARFSCSNPTNYEKVRYCLKNISFIKRYNKVMNYQIRSVLHMYFPLTYLIYHEYIMNLPPLAQKNTMEIIQIMHAYGSAPTFHNNPLFDYWNVLNSRISNPFRSMTNFILTSEVSEIISWIQNSNNDDSSTSEQGEEEYSNPLLLYENITKHSSYTCT